MRRMKKSVLFIFFAVVFLTIGSVQAHKWDKPFVPGIVVEVGHHKHKYYLSGAPDGPNGEQNIPGHEWVQVSSNTLIGKHYNTGPFGSSNFWSTDAPDGALLWTMIGKIDRWTEAKAAKYYTEGFVHYHHLVSVWSGKPHPKLVVWFRHSAVIDFTFDGVPTQAPVDSNGLPLIGPDGLPVPPAVVAYSVKIGDDYKMGPRWNVPYAPDIDH